MDTQIGKIKRVPLRELWRKEDKDFTKWLEEHIDFLNDAIGFDITIESREEKVGPFKVDLYGEDNLGNKVIIESQLEKTDHNHLGQLITYLTNLDANKAIWIAKEPTEEHIKAIDWLNEVSPDDISFYLIKLEAIKIGDQSPAGPLFSVIKRPTTEKKQIGLEKKEYAQRHVFREKFWTQFLVEINKKNSLFVNISPSTDNWIGIGMGRSGFNLSLVISKKYARAEIYINRGDIKENKKAFDHLHNLKDEIEREFGGKLTWERMEDNVTSRIKHQLDGVNVSNEDDWPKMNEFLIDSAERMHRAFKAPIPKLKT
ncbi:MAG: DUF4268 domain-containing protein [Thermodesulfobacteriota bacterium]